MRIAQEEIFGPVVSVIPCDSLDEAIAHRQRRGLRPVGVHLHAGHQQRVHARCATSTPGLFYVNAPTIGAEVHLPFGGTKATGNGHREAGIAALDVFSEWKSIYVDFSGRLQRAQMDTEQI